jgi:hypothetical protein
MERIIYILRNVDKRKDWGCWHPLRLLQQYP